MADLAKRIRAKYPGAYDDIDDATLERQVLAKHPEYQDLAEKRTTAPAAAPQKESFIDRALADNPGLPVMFRGMQALLRGAKDHPVQAGAMAGGALAAPFTGGLSVLPAALAVGGASAVGAGAGQLLSGQKPDLKTMATEGAYGMAGEGIGRGVASAARFAAPQLAKGVLKVSKSLQNEFGRDEIISSFLKEGIPVGQSAEAGARVGASADQARAMVAQAQAAGAAPVSVREVAQELRPVRDTAQLRVRLGKPDETAAIAGQVKAMKAANPSGIPLNDAQAMKSEAQKLSSRTFRAIDRGADVNDIGALTDKGVATGLRKGLESRVPGLHDVNAKTQSLMGLEHALADAEGRSPGFMGTNPMTWLGAVAPGTGSHLAFGADIASRAPIAGTLRNALIAALTGSKDDAQGP